MSSVQDCLLSAASIDFFSIFFYSFFFNVYGCFAYMCTMACFVSAEARRGYWISLNWSYRQVQTVLWVLGFERASCGRPDTLNYYAISSVPVILILCICANARHVGIHRDQKRVLDLLELDLQVAGSRLMSVLGTELRSSGKLVRVLSH